MTTHDHLKEFGEFLASVKNKLTPGQLKKAKSLLENVINSLAYLEQSKEKLDMESRGIKNMSYSSMLQKSIDLLILIGFDLTDIMELFNKEIIEFLLFNRKSLIKSADLTAARVTKIARIIKYHEQTTESFPQSMKEIITTYTQLNEEQNQD